MVVCGRTCALLAAACALAARSSSHDRHRSSPLAPAPCTCHPPSYSLAFSGAECSATSPRHAASVVAAVRGLLYHASPELYISFRNSLGPLLTALGASKCDRRSVAHDPGPCARQSSTNTYSTRWVPGTVIRPQTFTFTCCPWSPFFDPGRTADHRPARLSRRLQITNAFPVGPCPLASRSLPFYTIEAG